MTTSSLGMSPLDRVSLLIVTWDGDALLRACLDSVVKACGRLPETVVVDNAALPSTRALVADYPGATYVESPGNPGFAGGNDIGFPRCSRDYIVLLNNDTTLCGDALSELVRFADDHPKAALVQGRVVRGDNPDELDFCGFRMSRMGLSVSWGAHERASAAEFSTPARIWAPNGAFVLVRRAAVAAFGGLFHATFKSYYEDIDIGTRAGLCGFEAWYFPTTPVIHFGGKTARRFADAAILEQGYFNHWYSILISFGLYGRLRLGLPLLALSLAYSLLRLACGRMTGFRLLWRTTRAIWQNRDFLAAAHADFRARVRLSDRAFLRQVMVAQPWAHYREMFRS